MRLFSHLFRKGSKSAPTHVAFFATAADVAQLNLPNAVRRVAKSYKSDLVFDPLGYHEFEWLSQSDPGKLGEIVFEHYRPSPQAILNMPKKGFTFRPVAYLSPIDSIVYQAIVDKIIAHKRKYFSRQVFSEIIEDPKRPDVFNNPVEHWLEMREGIRTRYRQGSTYYFFSDISGYFENINIRPLLEQLKFFVGRKESQYLTYLAKVLETWHFAKAQGIIQPHTASSILGKVYLSPVDAHFAYMQKKYSRYVDEFHLLAETKAVLLRSSLELAEQLRSLGLNQNAHKSKLLKGEEVLSEFDKDQDFFNLIHYLRAVMHEYDEAERITAERFDKYVSDFRSGVLVNNKIFRYCIRKFGRARDPRAIDICFEIARVEYDQIVDIVRYLAVFANDRPNAAKIARFLSDYLPDKELCYCNWVEAWLLGLLLDLPKEVAFDMELIRSIAIDENKGPVVRSLCYLVMAKRFPPGELINLYALYVAEKSPILKRVLLECISRLPSTSIREYLDIEETDDVNMRVLRLYLSSNSYPDDSKIL